MNQPTTVAPKVLPKILVVFAHADDETLLAGALISKLVYDGHEVRALCLAPGDDDRTERLRKACDVLGVSTVETLRYSEGEMWPDEPGDHAEANSGQEVAPRLSTVPMADLAARIGGRFAEFNPEIVITHSVYGDYGHADHAAVHRATLHAVEQVSALTQRNLRLYALEWPRWVVRLNARLMGVGGRKIHRMGHDGRFNLSMALRASGGSQLSIEVGDHLAVRRRASRWYSKVWVSG